MYNDQDLNKQPNPNNMRNNLIVLVFFALIIAFASSCKKEPLECIAPSSTPLIAPSNIPDYYIVEIGGTQGGYQVWVNSIRKSYILDTLYSGDQLRVVVEPNSGRSHLVLTINGVVDIHSTCSCIINYTKTLD